MHLATSYVVLAEAPHLTGTMAAVDLRNPTQTPEQLKIVLHACDAFVVGDTLQQIDGRALRPDTKYAVWLIEDHTEGTPAKLLIERANTQLTLRLTPDAAS
jgi:hypothetical protein